jgi:hypothetical protein
MIYALYNITFLVMILIWYNITKKWYWRPLIKCRAFNCSQLLKIYTNTWELTSPHHAEGPVDPNLMYKKTVTGFRYPRACRIRKYQIENRLPSNPSLYQLVSKRDFFFIKCGKNWQKMTKYGIFDFFEKSRFLM